MGLVTCDIGISVDGFVAGPNQRLEEPLGDGAERLHRWMFEQPEANAEVIEKITAAGAFIMGRNMFGPVRGTWGDSDWTGWWGEEPPYHAPVFVLTHHPRESVTMKGGTTFHFVTDGIEAAMRRAREAAGDQDIAVAGGAQTVNQYLAAGLIDELRLHIAPVVLGAGERLFADVGDLPLEPVAVSHTDLVAHVTYRLNR
ncbi:RibD C-terminal domain-containing protein [Actinomadura meyerae]|jgi:dihydrofolate reductase|uniref:RibD C-terminal domain-containing protein n=1 Tax=Actinomadura meyerae TaxID=240840 RepID=A0A239LV81_9ACTN|nr:dihydrofolate reductase family protein [Actinomadura meyerae]SNT33778.1 RibD C-terminal domain-containing protein [Actinomadura meyerae]